jgi:hypothetical protein
MTEGRQFAKTVTRPKSTEPWRKRAGGEGLGSTRPLVECRASARQKPNSAVWLGLQGAGERGCEWRWRRECPPMVSNLFVLSNNYDAAPFLPTNGPTKYRGRLRRRANISGVSSQREMRRSVIHATFALPRKRPFAAQQRNDANGMDRPRSRPQRLSECAGGLSGEGAPPCLARPPFTQ